MAMIAGGNGKQLRQAISASMNDANDFGKSIHPGQIQALQHQRCILFQDQNENQTSYFGTLRKLHGCVPRFLRIFKSSTRLYLRSGF
jgi:hypothetical protein